MCAKFGKYALLVGLIAGNAYALPWDDDMFKQQSFKANEMSRAPAENTIPTTGAPFRMSTVEAAESLKNPNPATADSLARGKRVYSSNCVVCHGAKAAGDGPVGQGKEFGVPNLLVEPYLSSSDGKAFAVMQNGGTNMPRYGYKFSESLAWDVVNYLRSLQKSDNN